MPTLNALRSFSPQPALSANHPATSWSVGAPSLPVGARPGGLSLQGLRLLLGLLALILSVVGLSGCGGGFGEFKPTITSAVNDQTVKAGDTANFTVAATGTGPITYQWYKNGVAVPGSTATKFAMVAQGSDTGAKISAGATNAGGTAMSIGTLTVQVAPTITTQPVSQTIVAGQTASFSVVATGTAPLTYQWFQNGSAISGATSASYTTPAVSATGMNTYTVTVSNVIGKATSAPATLTVGSASPTLQFAPIATQTYGNPTFPVSATSASSGSVTYTVASGPATISGNTVTITGVGPVVLSASQAASGNYEATTATTTFTVNPEVPKLQFAPISAPTAGGTPFAVSATSASSGAVTYTVVSGPATVSGALVTVTGTGPVTLSASQAASGNYAAATATTTFTPGAQNATLAFAPIATQTFGNAAFAVSASSASSGAVTYSVTSGPATIAGNTVTVTGIGTVVLGANQAANGSYNSATASTSFAVNPAVPALQFAPIAAQTINSAPFQVSATSASSGAVTYSVVSGPATISGNTVTVTGNGTVTLSASQTASGNYTSATATTSFGVGSQTPSLAFAPIATQTFGGAPLPVSATSASSGAVTYAVVSGPATISGNTVTTTGVGTVVLSAQQAASGSYTSASVSTSFNVAAAAPTLAFAPIATHSFGDPPFTVTASSASSGAVTYSVTSGPATIVGNTLTLTGNGPVVLSASQAASGNYTSATVSTSFTAGAQTPTLAFAPVGAHSYGDAPFTVSATSASSGAVTYTVISGPATISGNTVTVTGAGTVILGASQAAANGYNAATANTTFSVGAEVPTLTFVPIATQVYGSAPIPVSATSASNGAVTYAVVSGPATVSGSTVTTTGIGNVILSASQAASGSYAAAVATTNFNVTAATPTLAFAPIPAHSYGDAPFTVSATSASSGAVTYAVISGPATISGNTVTLTGNGAVVLGASQAANGNYGSATAQTSVAVGNATPTLTFAPVANHTYGDAPFPVNATSASSGAVTYSVVSGPATISGNTVTITGNGAVVISANQAGSGSYNAATAQTNFTVGAATPTLTFAPIANHSYGDAPFMVSATSASSGAVTYSVISGPATISGNTVTLTGNGSVILGASQAANGNYSSATSQTSIAVGSATPNLAFAPIANKTYGDTAFTVSATSASSGAVTYSVVSGPATISGNTVTLTGNGNVVLGANQAASGSYSAATAQTNFTVATATPALAFAPISNHTYGDAPFNVSATSASSGAVTYSVISGPATLSGNTVTITGNGSVVLGASQAANGSYSSATAQSNFTVGAASPTLTFAPVANHTYGDAPFNVSATSASSGAVTYSVVSGPATISGNTVTLTGNGSVVLGASQAANGSYSSATAQTNFTVGTASPTLTFAPIPAHNYGDAPFTISASSASSGAVTYSVLSGPATLSGNTVTLTGSGSVVLGASQAASGSYSSATAQTNLTAGTATPALAFAPIANHTYGDAPFTVSAISASSGAVTYTVVSGPATISGNTVTITGNGSVVLGASQAASGSYSSATAQTNFSVGAATPALTFAPIANHTYGDPAFTVSASSASPGPVTYAVASGPATISGNTVTITGTGNVNLTANQAASGSYAAATPASASFTVSAAAPNLAFAPIPTQTYGGAPFKVSASSASTGAVTYSVVSGPATISGNTVTVTGDGTVTLGASQAADANYTSATTTTFVNVGVATPTLTFAPVGAHTYGDAPFTVTASSASSGAVTYSVASGPATISGNTVTLTGTGTVVLNANQAPAPSYGGASASTSVTVGNATPTLTFTPVPNHTYGDAPFTVSATSASSGPVVYAVQSGPATISGNTVTLTGTGTVMLTANQAASGNYAAAAQATTNFTVGSATPTLAFTPIPNHTYGDASFTVSASSASSGPVVYAVQSGPATISGNTVMLTGTGTVVLTANQAASGNYAAAAQATTNFTVGSATPTLTFAPVANHTYGEASFTVSASSASSGPVVYTVQSGPATISGNTVTLTGTGTVVLTANQAASGNYAAAAQATTNFSVGAATPTLSFAPIGNHTYGDASFTVSATSASSGPVVYAVQSGPATISGNTVTLTGTGTVVLTANQAASGNYAAAAQATTNFSVGAATPTLSFAPIGNHTYGDAPFTVSATSASSGAVTYAVTSGNATISGNTVTITGTGPVVLAATQAAAGNYAAANASTNFSVAAATPTIKFSVSNQNYGAAAFPVNATSNSAGAFTYTVTSGPATISGNTVTVTGVGTVVLGVSQAANGNYTAVTGSATFTVNAVAPTLSLSVPNHTYGDAAFPVNATSNSAGAITYTVTSGPATVSGNTVTLTGAGTVVLGVSQAANGNYTAGSTTANFTVAAEAPALSLTVPNHTFGDAAFQVNATSPSTGAITYTVTSGPATVSGNTVTLTGAGTVVLGVSQAANGNYTAATTSATFTVAPATPAITFNVPNHTFGDAPFTVSASSASTGAYTYSVVSGPATVSGSTVTLTGSGAVVLKATQAATTNYAAASANANFTVAGASPTIVFNIPNHTYGDAPFTVAATSNSTGSFTYAVVSGNATISGNTVTLTGTGPVQLSATQAAAGNFAAGSANANFTVATETPTITFVVPNHTYGDAPFTVNATSNSPGAITYSVVSGNATISGNTVTLTGAGTVVLKATQATSGNFGTNSATASFNVAQNVTVSNISPANATVAPGTVTYTATVQGGLTNAVTWSASAGSFNGNVWTSPNTAGSYTITATSVEDSTKSASTTVTVSKPVITQQPTGSNVCANGSFSLSVTANYAVTYQWYLGTTAISGATGATYNISGAQASRDSGNYTVQVTNPAGTTTSNVATIVVASIVKNPVSVTADASQTATFSTEATGSNSFTYQWYSIAPGSSSTTGTAIAGATSNVYTTPTLAASNNGTRYYAIATDTCGNALQSTTATLTVLSSNAPPTITGQPQSQDVAVGATPTFSVTATGTPTLTYQWYVIPAGKVAGTAVSGATSASYTLPASSTTAANSGDSYYAVVTNSYGSAVSQSGKLAVGNGILITGQPQSVYTSVGSPATYNVTATSLSPSPLTYQWYGAAPGSSTFAAISGATSPTYTIASTTGSQTGSVFYAVVSNSSSSAQSNSASLFVGPLADIPANGTWNTVGSAQAVTGGYQIVPPANFTEGDIVWPSLISTGDIQLNFTVTLSDTSNPPADGFAVVLGDPSLGATLTSTGANGQGLGAEGIPGLVLAFDDYANSGDPQIPYVGIGRGETALWENPYTNVNTNIPALATPGQSISHAYTVTIHNGFMTATMDGNQIFSGQVNVPPVAYLYVTSSTGGSYERTVVTNISAAVTAP